MYYVPTIELNIYDTINLHFIKYVSSSTSHKKTPSFRLSVREFKKILPYTLIYESILTKLL